MFSKFYVRIDTVRYLLFLLAVFLVLSGCADSNKETVVEGTVESIVYADAAPGQFIIRCDRFHEIYRTYRFAYTLHESTEVVWGSGTLSASELRVGDVVRITGTGAEPNPVGRNDPVGFRVQQKAVLLERGNKP